MINLNLIKINLLIYFIILILCYILNPVSILNFTLFLIAPLVPVIAAYKVQKIYGANNIHSKAVKFIYTGFIFNFLTELTSVIFRYFDIRFESLSPSYIFTALADIFFFIGIIYEFRNYKITIKIIYKYLLYFVSAIVLLIMIYYYYDPTDTLLQNTINILFSYWSYIFLLLIILITAMIREFKNGKMYYPWIYIFIGTFFMFLGGIVLALFITQYRMGEKIIVLSSDTTWAIGYLAMGFGLYNLADVIQSSKNQLFYRLKIASYLTNKKHII